MSRQNILATNDLSKDEAAIQRNQSRIPALLPKRDDWTPSLIAHETGVPIRTVRYWCRATAPDHKGHWKLDYNEAQKVVNRMLAFSSRKNLAV